ncbi:MFS transporter [Prosthecomicrobium sp. N25]|uniref:MFS transporter n=1 Tax=Prosthecomicrobium sp. N25 TaxID=3129254 RepID=UPI0030771991
MTTTHADPVPDIAESQGTAAASLQFGGLALSVLLASIGTSSANVALPTLSAAFAVPFAAVQWVVLAYLLAIVVLIVIAGALSDGFGRRRVLMAGLILFAVGSAISGAAPSFALLVGARAIQGAGAAAMLALALAFVSEVVPKERIGRVMGTMGAISAAGTAFGPALGGWLIASVGWPAVFLVNVPIAFAALGLVARTLPRDAAAVAGTQTRFDAAGAVTLGLTLAAFCFATTATAQAAIPLLVICAAGLALLLRIESRAVVPVIPLALLRDPVLAQGLALNALVSMVMMATLVVGPFHLSRALGLDPPLTGMAMSAGPIVSALAGRPAGWLTDRFGPPAMTIGGLAAMTLGAALLAASPVASGLAGYLVPLVVLTAGYALLQASNNTAIMGSAQADRRGSVSGLLNLTRYIGLLAGASGAAAFFAMASGLAQDPSAGAAAVAYGTSLTFGAAAVATGTAVLVAAARWAGSPQHRKAGLRMLHRPDKALPLAARSKSG